MPQNTYNYNNGSNGWTEEQRGTNYAMPYPRDMGPRQSADENANGYEMNMNRRGYVGGEGFTVNMNMDVNLDESPDQNQQMEGGQTQPPAPQQPRPSPVSEPLLWPEPTQAQRRMSSGGLQMESMMTSDLLDGPTTNAELMRASLKGLLVRNVGFYIVASFILGSGNPVSWEGILYSVGTDYIVLYQPDVDRYISGDLYSLKFVEFHNTRNVSPWAGYRRQDGIETM